MDRILGILLLAWAGAAADARDALSSAEPRDALGGSAVGEERRRAVDPERHRGPIPAPPPPRAAPDAEREPVPRAPEPGRAAGPSPAVSLEHLILT